MTRESIISRAHGVCMKQPDNTGVCSQCLSHTGSAPAHAKTGVTGVERASGVRDSRKMVGTMDLRAHWGKGGLKSRYQLIL